MDRRVSKRRTGSSRPRPAIFFIARRAGYDQVDSARHALVKNLMPTILTSVSTAIGFFSFATAELKPLGELGILAGVGAIIAWFLTYLIVGPLMASRFASDEE